MNKECEMVRDLLPLVVDEVCSDASKEYVRSHLESCGECRQMFCSLQNREFDSRLESECEGVIERQSKKYKRKSMVAGSIMAGILMIPVLICLVVNLATGYGLTWFFIVLSSLLVVASLLVVPFMVSNHRFLWTIGSFTASLILLLGVCSIYSHGGFFMIATSSVLFGLSVVFLPIVVNCEPIKSYLKNKKLLFILTVDVILFFMMLACIFIGSMSVGEFFIFAISLLPIVLMVVGVIVLWKYLKVNTVMKTGIVLLVVTIIEAARVFWINGGIDGGDLWIAQVAAAIAGIALTGIGAAMETKKRNTGTGKR